MTNIAVIGESCVDEYVYGICDRICPEAAALCFRTNESKSTNPGMSGNVLKNILALNNKLNITHITNTNSIIKRRFIDYRYNTIVFREDINDTCEFLDIQDHSFDQYDAIVFSDYCKGFLSDEIIIKICKQANSSCNIFMDTKRQINTFVQYIDFLKINNKEFNENISNIDIIKHYTNVIVTRGEDGAVMYAKDTTKEYPVKKIEVRDVCGAGDTFLAALVVEYLKNKNIDDAINYANQCATKVVSKFGVTTP